MPIHGKTRLLTMSPYYAARDIEYIIYMQDGHFNDYVTDDNILDQPPVNSVLCSL